MTEGGGDLKLNEPLQEITLDLPQAGLIAIEKTPFGDARIAWITGLYAMSTEQALFTSQIADGEIPHRSVRRLNSGLPSTRLIAPYSPPPLSSPPIPLWSILKLEDELLQAARQSTHRICTRCGLTLPILSDVSTLQSAVVQDWSGQFARIYLCGPQELHEWGAAQGFQKSDVSSPHFNEIRNAVLIDATEISSDALLRLRRILAESLRFTGSTVWVSDSIRTTTYSANGACSGCRIDGEPLTKVTLNKRLHSEQNDALPNTDTCLSRLIGEVTLATMLNAPLRTLQGSQALPISSLADALTRARLGDLSLLSSSDDLGESGCALARTITELLKNDFAAVTILDSPFCGMSLLDARSLKLFLESQSTGRLLVVLGTLPKHEPEKDTVPTSAATLPGESPWVTVTTFVPSIDPEQVVAVGKDPVSILSLARNLSTPFLRSLCALPNDLGSPQLEIIDPLRRSNTSLVVDDLGWYDGFCKIFAASHAARVNGFTPQAFKRTSTRPDSLVCKSCKGLGLSLKRSDRSIVDSGPCPVCRGHRFTDTVARIQFRGRTVWEVLAGSIEENRNLIRTVPRATALLEVLSIVELTYLPLGLPSELLTQSEQILLQCAVAAVPPSNGSRRLIFCRYPTSTLSPQETEALLRLVKSTDSKKVRWCFESDDASLHRIWG